MRGWKCCQVSAFRRGKSAFSPKSRLVGGSRVLRCQIERCLWNKGRLVGGSLLGMTMSGGKVFV